MDRLYVSACHAEIETLRKRDGIIVSHKLSISDEKSYGWFLAASLYTALKRNNFAVVL